MCKTFQNTSKLFVKKNGTVTEYDIDNRQTMTDLKETFGGALKYDIRTSTFSVNLT